MPAIQNPPPPVDDRVDVGGEGGGVDEDDVSKDVFLNKQND